MTPNESFQISESCFQIDIDSDPHLWAESCATHERVLPQGQSRRDRYEFTA